VAGIFLGKITNWDNSAIATLNPGVKLPNLAIVAVHRADSSGPGYDLDQYLIDTGGAAWTAAVGTKPSTHVVSLAHRTLLQIQAFSGAPVFTGSQTASASTVTPSSMGHWGS
jgi:ABC-type phosphate transport system substrate-binding protein